METIIAVSITGIFTLAGTIISAKIIKEKDRALFGLRLDRIEQKLDVHNGYAEKFGEIQKDIAVMRNDMTYMKEMRK